MDFDFSKNNTVESVDTIPQDFRPFYKEADGKHVLDSDNPATKSAVSLITKLNQSLKAARAEAQGFKGKAVDLSTLSEYGSTVEEITTNVSNKIKELQEAATTGKDAKVNLEKIKADLAAGHAKDLEGFKKKNEALTGQLYGLMVENAAALALGEAKGNAKLLMPFIKEQVKVVEEDGQFKVFVVDKANERRYSGTTGEPMSIKELVAELKANAEFSGAFTSDAGNGGGARPGSMNRPHTGKNPAEVTKNPTSKIAAGLAKRG